MLSASAPPFRLKVSRDDTWRPDSQYLARRGCTWEDPHRRVRATPGGPMTIRNSALPRLASMLLLAMSLSGCTALDRLTCTPNCGAQTRASSSLVDFLYPEGASPPAANSIPELRVPLRVGLAFLPE